MKQWKNTIALNKNNRGCYILDTIKGCSACSKEKPNGCYGNCYAKNISSRYNFDFSNIVKRDFYKDKQQLYLFDYFDTKHVNKIIKKLKKIDMPFVRIGEMGDPSENWNHTINVCKMISVAKKSIVIITKHLNTIPNSLLTDIKKLDICINTSISALDTESEINHRLKLFSRLKKYCNSVLRIVSCDFNKSNIEGLKKYKIQEKLFKNDKVIDTIFRPNLNNNYVTSKMINVDKIMFLKKEVYASIYNTNTHFGYCSKCHDMCGINL